MKDKLKKKKDSSALSMREKMLLRKKELEKSKGGSGDWIFPKEGTTRVRILPTTSDAEIGVELLTFYLGKQLGGIISPATFGDPCPFLEKYQKAKKKGDKGLMKTLSPRRKYVIAGNVYKEGSSKDFDESRLAKPIQIPVSLYQQIIDLFVDEEEWGDMTNFEEGYDVKIVRSGTDLDTTYSLAPCQKKPLQEKYQKVVDLESLVRKKIKSYEELEELLAQYLSGSVEDTSDDEEDRPKKKLKKRDLPF